MKQAEVFVKILMIWLNSETFAIGVLFSRNFAHAVLYSAMRSFVKIKPSLNGEITLHVNHALVAIF